MENGKTLFFAALSASVLGLNGSTAKAGDFDHLWFDLTIGQPRHEVRRVWVEPAYETRCERVWIEPVYQTQCQRVWHEAVYESREQRVWLPDRYDVRCESVHDRYGNRVTREVRVLVERGHWDCRTQQVLVREGCWEEVPQQVCVSQGRWEQVEQRVLVRDGYWNEEVCAVPGSQFRIGYVGGHGDDHHNTDYRGRRDGRDDRHDGPSNSHKDGDDRTARDHDRAAREHYDSARQEASRRFERGGRSQRG